MRRRHVSFARVTNLAHSTCHVKFQTSSIKCFFLSRTKQYSYLPYQDTAIEVDLDNTSTEGKMLFVIHVDIVHVKALDENALSWSCLLFCFLALMHYMTLSKKQIKAMESEVHKVE